MHCPGSWHQAAQPSAINQCRPWNCCGYLHLLGYLGVRDYERVIKVCGGVVVVATLSQIVLWPTDNHVMYSFSRWPSWGHCGTTDQSILSFTYIYTEGGKNV